VKLLNFIVNQLIISKKSQILLKIITTLFV